MIQPSTDRQRENLSNQHIETALENSYQLLYAMVEGASDAIFLKNLSGQYLMLNSATAQIFGLSTEEVFGKDDTQLLPPEVAARIQEQDRLAIATGETQEVEEEIPTGGVLRTYLTKKSPYRDSEGKVIGLIGVKRDISDRVEIEKQLRSTNQKLSLLIEQTPLAFIEWNQDLSITAWNPTASTMFGYSASEAIGQPLSFLMPENAKSQVNPDNLLTSNSNYCSTNENITKDLRHITCQWYHTPLRDSTGNFMGAVSWAVDITERVYTENLLQAEHAQLRAVFAGMTDVVFVWDAQGNYLEIAPTKPVLFSQAEIRLIGDTLHNVFPIELVEIFLSCIQEALKSGEPVSCDYCVPIESKDVWFAATISPISSEQVICICRNITSEMEREQELLRYQRHLEELVQERTAKLAQMNEQLQTEIIGRQQSEAALQKSETQYRSVVENVKEVIFQTNARGEWKFLNPAWTEIMGYSTAESIGKQLWESIHPSDRALAREEFSQLMSCQRDYYRCEVRWLTSVGKIRWVEVFGNRIEAEDATVQGVSGILNDITDRKLAEEKLRETARNLQAAQRMAHIGNWEFDVATQTMTWSAEYFRICGLEPGTAPTLDEFQLLLHPEYREPHAQMVQEAIATGKSYQIDFSIIRPDGAIRHISGWGETQKNDRGVVERLFGLVMDVTDRVIAQKALQKSEARLAGILNLAADAVISIDAGQRITLFNQGAVKKFGYSPSEAIGQPLDILLPERLAHIHRQHVDRFQESSERARRMGDRLEILARRRDGTEFPAEASISKLYLEGEIILTVILTDITERKQAELALRQSEERFRQLAENINAVFWMTNPAKSQMIYVSPAYEKIWGRSCEKLYAEPATWLDAIHPEDRDRMVSASTQQGRGEYDQEYRIITGSGELRWIRDRAFGVENEAGQIYRIAGIAEDITDRKLTQAALERERQHLRQIVRNAPVAMAMFDSQMCYIAYSNKWLADYNLTDDSLIGRSHYEIFPYLPERWQSIYQRALQGEVIGNPEDLFDREDGSKIYLRWAIQPWYEPDGTIGGMVMVTDIINELVEAREAALEAARLKSQFLANMSHEIRTPMNGVLGMTDLLLKTPLNEQQRDFVKTLYSSGENLLLIINDILDFSKLEAGEMRLDPHDFDLKKLLENLLDLFAPQTAAKGLELAGVVEPEVPRFLKADAARLRQIFTNLIGNAIKFTETGEIVIQVSVDRPNVNSCADRNNTCGDQCHLRFSVRDTGIGIPKAARKKLFKSFSQVDASTTRKYGGTGLGLAICKQLITLMGGEIGIESEEGVGSTFWFTIATECGSPVSEETIDFPTEVITGKKLLVVDDNATNRQVVRLFATSWGMEVSEAEDGQSALTALRDAATEGKPYEVALLDMQMPQMNGEMLGQLIGNEPALAQTKLILLTSLDGGDIADRVRKIGFVGYLLKPIKESSLYDCLMSSLVSKSEVVGSTQSDASDREHHVPQNFHAVKIKIILVEDTPINQKVVLNQLRQLGVEADCVNNGQEFLDTIEQEWYEIVLMDCQMPVLDGYQATRLLREREGDERHAVVIGLTANAMKGDREKCLAAGMDDYLSKPVSMSDLSAVISRWLPLEAKEPIPDSDSPVDSEDRSPVDSERLEEITRGDEEFKLELLQEFVEDAFTDLEELQTALLAKDAGA
ncbi:MAG: PAS domain S-box protein, partial [Hormoscilla sp.]